MEMLTLAEKSKPFLDEVERWMGKLPALTLAQAAPHPERTAVISVDVINGFCYSGPLSSPRVAGIVDPIRELFESAWQYGVRQIVLVQDTHEPDAVEFAQFPPHCVRGTAEAETVQAFKDLPFYPQMHTFEKNSIHSGLNTGLESWLTEHSELDTFIVVGDCTDLCTDQLAMYLRLRANALQLRQRVIVPANTVDTYDMPVETAREVGAMAHPGDTLHGVFLYHMALNGVEIVKEICA
jgi:nicotinamidase-related amidase